MFAINVNCICCEKGKDKTVFFTENIWSRSGSLFVTENFWSRVTPSVTSVESSEHFAVKYAKFGVFANPGLSCHY